MAKKIQNKAATMSPLFPQYDLQELEQSPSLKENNSPLPFDSADQPTIEKSPQMTTKKSVKKSTVSAKTTKKTIHTNKTLPSKQLQQSKISSPLAKSASLRSSPKKELSTSHKEHALQQHLEPAVPPEMAPENTRSQPMGQSSPPHPTTVLSGEPEPKNQPLSSQNMAQQKISFSDIPEDALPPPRPEPILALRLSVPLHAKLIAQARDESLSVESLALEMLAESVVLRAWEIVERKNAMRGQNQSQPPNQRNLNNRPPRSGSHGESSFNHSGNGPYHNSNTHPNNNSQGQPRDQRGGYRRPHQGWKDDQSQFLEYVRNQEKRNRR